MKNLKSEKIPICLQALIIITTLYICGQINDQIKMKPRGNIDKYIINEKVIFNELKTYENLGWFNLAKLENYTKGSDIVFVCFQYLVAPASLEDKSYSKMIICYYTSPIQLKRFCRKNKKYKIIKANLLNNFALLEKVN